MFKIKNFLYIKKKALSSEKCKSIIDWFENNPSKQRVGAFGTKNGIVVDTNIKDSKDIEIFLEEDNIVNKLILEILDKSFYEYQSNYHVLQNINDWQISESYNIQKYDFLGGYKDVHFESSGLNSCHRLFAWMIYLNNIRNGGTIFPYINQKISSEEGKLLIWPAGFTHSHKSQVTTRTKYIITGWANFYNS